MVIPATSTVTNGYCMPLSDWSSPPWARLNGIVFFLQCFVIPVAVFCYCYGHMAMKVLKRGQVSPLEEAHVTTENNMKVFGNMLKMLLVVVAVYVICWILISVMYVLLNFGVFNSRQKYSRSLYNVCSFMAFANCVVNPFVYAAKYRQFQNGVKKLMGGKVSVTRAQVPKSTNRTTGITKY